MKKILFQSILLLLIFNCGISNVKLFAQPVLSREHYQETPERINDLVHTKLDVRFNYEKKILYGKEWVTIKPHFYPTDSLRLDAWGIDIHKIAVLKKGKLLPLGFDYDNKTIAIKLDKVYKNTEKYIVFIDYTAKPDELKKIKKNQKRLILHKSRRHEQK